MNNKIVSVLIGVFVGILLLGSVLMPVLNDASDNQRTIYNNTVSNKYSLLYDEDLDSINATIEIRDFSERKLYVTMDGITEEIALRTRDSMLMSDKGYIRVDAASGDIRMFLSGETTQVRTSVVPFTVTITNGNVVVSDSDTVNYTFTPEEWLFIPDNDGDYELVQSDYTGIYVNSINDMYFATIIDTNELGFAWGSDGKCTFYNTGETYDMFAQSIEKIDGYTDLYKIDMADYCISTDAGTNSDGAPFCPYMVMVPVSVDAHTVTNESIIAILAVIPVMVIITLIAVSLTIITRRY